MTSLTDLLKKDGPWAWKEDQKKAFKKLKATTLSEPMLKLPNFNIPFKVHTNASYKVVEGVLV